LQALNSFKDGHIKALVATDVAARGIDIDSLACVINFELPKNPEDYIHRIGRTGRAGEKGYAISLVSSDDHTTLGSIEELLKTTIKKENGSDLLPKKLVVSSDTKNISIQKPRRSNPKAVKDLLFSQPYVPKNTSAKNDALCGAPINQNSINNGARNRFNRPIPALFFSFATNKQQKDE